MKWTKNIDPNYLRPQSSFFTVSQFQINSFDMLAKIYSIDKILFFFHISSYVREKLHRKILMGSDIYLEYERKFTVISSTQ